MAALARASKPLRPGVCIDAGQLASRCWSGQETARARPGEGAAQRRDVLAKEGGADSSLLGTRG